MRRGDLFTKLCAIACCALSLSACASAGPDGMRVRGPERSVRTGAVIGDYVRQLPPGSAVRVERWSGADVRGTLMKTGDDVVIVQARTRIPEPPVEIPLEDVARVTLEKGGGRGLAKAIAAGVAAGAGAAVTVFYILVAIYSS